MTPGGYPLQLYRGDSYRWQFNLFDDLAQTQPSDLTGVTAASQICDSPGGVLVCSMVCDIVLPNTINVTLAAADSARLPSSAAWDLQLTYASGDVATVLAGQVNVTPDVTGGEQPVPMLRFVRVRR